MRPTTIELGIEMEALRSYALVPEDDIWIIGAFKGATAEVCHELYGTKNIRCFDPQPHACDHLAELGRRIPAINITAKALGARGGYFPMRKVGSDACSFYGAIGRFVEFDGEEDDCADAFQMIDIRDVWTGEDVGLLIMNCEGSELELLPRMYDIGMLTHIKHLLVQFHTHVGDPPTWESIVGSILQTHVVTFPRWPAWMGWTRR